MMSTPFVVFGNRMAQIVFNCLFSIGIIVTNFMLIGAILSKKETRQNSKYILIALLSVTDLYVGLFLIPVYTHSLVTQTLDYSCVTSLVLNGSAYVITAVSCLAIVSINIDTILQMSMQTYRGPIRKASLFILSLFFLGGPLIFLVPIFVNGQSPSFAGGCLLALELPYARAAAALAYWVPSGCIVITTIIAIIVHQRARRAHLFQQMTGQQMAYPAQTLPVGADQANVADLILAACLTVSLELPTQALSLAGCLGGTCNWYFMMVIVFSYVGNAKSVLLPLVWFVNKDFRNILLGRGRTSPQPLMREPPPAYFTPTQYLSNPVVDQTYQNNGFQASTAEKS